VEIITTRKGTDFDALASVVAANMLYPDAATVLLLSLNPNVGAFLSLHKDLSGFCTSPEIDRHRVDEQIVVDTSRWARLDRGSMPGRSSAFSAERTQLRIFTACVPSAVPLPSTANKIRYSLTTEK
jgi:hypothetical protein